MNKFFKVLLAILGATYAVFSIFLPISVVLLLITTGMFSQFNNIMLIVIGLLASIYKALSIGWME